MIKIVRIHQNQPPCKIVTNCCQINVRTIRAKLSKYFNGIYPCNTVERGCYGITMWLLGCTCSEKHLQEFDHICHRHHISSPPCQYLISCVLRVTEILSSRQLEVKMGGAKVKSDQTRCRGTVNNISGWPSPR